MVSPTKLRTRKSLARKEIKLFDPTFFLANVGRGRTLRRYRTKQAVFSQGDRADAVFYIRQGKVRLSVVSKQGKEATIALLGSGDFLGEGCIASDQPIRLATRDRHYGVLYPEDRKKPDAAHAPRGTRFLRHVCCLFGRTSQPHASGLG